MKHTTAMMYTRIRERDVVEWCAARFDSNAYEVKSYNSPGGTSKALVVLFERANHKLMFDLGWSGEVNLYESADDYFNKVSFSIRSAFRKWTQKRLAGTRHPGK